MEIPSSPEQLSRPLAASPVRPAELLAQLQPGQTLVAKVERLLTNNEVDLKIGNQLLRAQSPVQLAVGQPLNLLVEKSAQGPILRVTQPPNQTETLAQAWRTVLPRQQPIADVIRLITTIFPEKKPGTAPLAANTAAPLQAAIKNLVSNLPSVQDISQAAGLRQAIQNSGVTLEAQLRDAVIFGKTPDTTRDLKANLLRLAVTALQFQPRSEQTVNQPLNAANPANIPHTQGASKSVDTYTALIAAGRQTVEPGKLSLTERPLLPPLPPATTTGQPISDRLLANLPQFLQRLLPLSLLGQSAPGQANPSQVTPLPAQATQLPIAMLTDLLNQLESGLARVQQHQLNSLPGDEAIRHFLNLELPVFNGKQFENIGFKIEWGEQAAHDKDQQHQWRVVLNFDFAKLGKTQVIIRSLNNEIVTDFRNENTSAQEFFQSHINVLEEGFRKQGLTPGKITFRSGEVDTQQPEQSDHLLKTRA